MRAAPGEKWLDEAANVFAGSRLPRDAKGAVNWDTHALLSVMAGQWNSVFSKKLGKAERNLVEELRATRNDWAHQKPFSTDDAYRALDSVERLLRAVGAMVEAENVKRLRLEVLGELTSTNRAAAISANATGALAQEPVRPGSASVVAKPGSVSGNYGPLHARMLGAREDETTIAFEQIEHLLADKLPASAYKHRAWRANKDPFKTVLRGKRAWRLAGSKAYPDMRVQRVTFRRGWPAPEGGVARGGFCATPKARALGCPKLLPLWGETERGPLAPSGLPRRVRTSAMSGRQTGAEHSRRRGETTRAKHAASPAKNSRPRPTLPCRLRAQYHRRWRA
jgi:hypothetical protein